MRLKHTLMLLCMATGSVTTHAAGKDTLTVNETDLRAFEAHDEVLLTVTKPLYRLGEILELGVGGGYVVPVSYYWERNHWEYVVVPVKVGTKTQPTKGS